MTNYCQDMCNSRAGEHHTHNVNMKRFLHTVRTYVSAHESGTVPSIGTAIVPLNVCFMDLRKLDKFMEQLNEVRVCTCKGKLHVKSAGLGGVVSIGYKCTGVLVKLRCLKCPPNNMIQLK